jgi:hypothetical protein
MIGGASLGLILGPLVAWRSYRRRAAAELRVWPDRVEFAGGATPLILKYEEIETLRVRIPEGANGSGGIEVRGAGRGFELGQEWPLQAIATDLGRALLPSMLERAAARLERGEALEFRNSFRSRALPLLGLLVSGTILCFVGWQFVRRWKEHGLGKGSPLFLLLLLGGFVGAASRLRRRWGRGLFVSKSGLRRPGEDDAAETPWAALREAVVRGGVLELTSDGATYGYPTDGPNALLLRGLVERYRPKT